MINWNTAEEGGHEEYSKKIRSLFTSESKPLKGIFDSRSKSVLLINTSKIHFYSFNN